uniref:Uncharacterized protein n=1 Tax=Periophthalmus magnuspinnatus TaxID=409849 RepID=A0A3B4AF19_9GOBI
LTTPLAPPHLTLPACPPSYANAPNPLCGRVTHGHETAAQRYSATRIQAGYEPERSVCAMFRCQCGNGWECTFLNGGYMQGLSL